MKSLHNRVVLCSCLSSLSLGSVCLAQTPKAVTDKANAVQEYLNLRDVRVEAVTEPVGTNLLDDGDFENAATEGQPAGWSWVKGKNNSKVDVDRSSSLFGQSSVHFTFDERQKPGVYNSLVLTKPVRLKAGTTYTLSAYLKSEGVAGYLTGGQSWQVRTPLTRTSGEWRRISQTFTPSEKDTEYQPRILIDGLTFGTWIDGMKLEAGTAATPFIAQKAQLTFEPTPNQGAIQGDGNFEIPLVITLPQKPAQPLQTTLEVVMPGAVQPLKRTLTLTEDVTRLFLVGESLNLSSKPRRIEATIHLDTPLKTATNVRFYSQASLKTRLAILQQKLPGLEKQVEVFRAKGQDVSYPMVPLSALKIFEKYAIDDLAYRVEKRPTFLWRASNELDAMEAMASKLQADLQRHTASNFKYPDVPRWTGTVRPHLSRTSFLGPAKLGNGAVTTERPIFFNGFGHFDQVVNDIEKWPALGTNIIQIETGPLRLFPAEDRMNTYVIQDLKRTLDRAQQAKVAVCLLLSPHYFPKWMLEKYPDLDVKRYGFMHFSIYAPETQVFLKKYVTTLLRPLKDHPALHSICVSNEPINVEAPGPYQAKDWRIWLQKRHGTIANLNGIWGTKYTGFDSVPLPNAMSLGPKSPQSYDYLRFNQDAFALWHQQLVDAVKSVTPGLPVHSKVIQHHFYSNYQNGLNAYQFSRMFNINGNDAGLLYYFPKNEFAGNWQNTMLPFDMQSSLREAPLFNSENHLIPDGETRIIPPAHIRMSLWQGAIHGQSATTVWDWERSYDPASNFYGLFMERPDCLAEVGLTNLDLNRAASEVSALQRLRPQIGILHSVSSGIWNDFEQADAIMKSYTALAFTGLKQGFVDELQLEAGIVPQIPILVIPNSRNLSAAARQTLTKYQGHLVLVGEQVLGRDEYNRVQPTQLSGDSIPFKAGESDWKELWKAFLPKLSIWKLSPSIRIEGSDGQPVWGVEWLSSSTAQGLLVNVCNYRQTPITIRLRRNGRDFASKEVLSGRNVTHTLTLQPMETRLLRAENP